MSIYQELAIPPELEILMAQELAVALAAKYVGFCFEAFEVQWSGTSHEPRALCSVSGIHLLISGEPEQRRAYIEKRIAVLCARAYAAMLVLTRRVNAEGQPPSGNEFWQILQDNGDRFRVEELCAAYLIESKDSTESKNLEEEFFERQNQYILRFGLDTLAKLLTEKEFLSFVEQSLRNFKRSNALFQTMIDAELLERYEPGVPTLEIRERARLSEQPSYLSTDFNGLIQSRSEEDDDASRRCLVAHELGHWLAARYVEIPTSGVELNLAECVGFCTVFVGLPAFHWSLECYLSARIAVLCAGSYADCWLRHPDKRCAIGGVFYSTLCRKTGMGDFAKLMELYLLYRTIARSVNVRRDLASPPCGNEILSVLTSLLREFKLYESLRSPGFENFAKQIFCEAKLSGMISSNAPSQFIEFKTARLDASCAEHGISRNGE